jgi:protein O-mannosyl-transferase
MGFKPDASPDRRQSGRRKNKAASPGSLSKVSPSPFMRDRFVATILCGLLLLAVGLVFGQTLGYQFVYDDEPYIYANPTVMRGLTAEGMTWALTATYASNWHPLTWFSHMLDCQLYGLQPWGHHLSNVVLHAANTILLLLILWRMTGDLWPSAFVAAVFAIHPLRVESVAWVAERKDVLSGLFFMLTLAAYVGYTRRPFSVVRYLTVIVSFGLGLMAKPMLVTLPFVLLLLDYWPLGRMSETGRRGLSQFSRRDELCPANTLGRCENGTVPLASPGRLVVEKIPLLVLTAASCAATYFAQGAAMTTTEQLPIAWRFANAVVAYVAYVGQFFWPAGLAALYPHPGRDLEIWKFVVALLSLVGVSAAAMVQRRRFPYVLVGWFWYLGMLVPVIGLVQVGLQSMADRYTYLPQIGLCLVVAWGAAAMVAAWPNLRRAFSMAGALAVLVLMGCAWRQTTYWRNSETLWNRALACTSGNSLAHYSLAVAISIPGREEEAIRHYREALKIKPDYVDAYNNLGATLAERGEIDAAIATYEDALKHAPNDVDVNSNLGAVLSDRGQLDAAISHFESALRVKPNHGQAHCNLGLALARRGDLSGAMAHLEDALRIKPGFVDAYINLGLVFNMQGQFDEAIAQYHEALKYAPDNPTARTNLGIILAKRGELNAAIEQFQIALRVKPYDATARYRLGEVLYRQGKVADAIVQWREALRLQPRNVVVVNQLAWVLATSPDASIRNGQQAVKLAQRAVEISAGKEPAILDTLAAAHAQAGQFDRAAQAGEQAVELATSQNKAALAATIKTRMVLYQSGKPFIDGQPVQASAPASGGEARSP